MICFSLDANLDLCGFVLCNSVNFYRLVNNDAQLSVLNFIRAFCQSGVVFDFTVGLSFLFIYFLYLLFFRRNGLDLWWTKYLPILFSLILFIIYFSLIAEILFWEEFGIRFNFIAVDYLIYTYEVAANINQSYPLPLIIAFLLMLIVLTFLYSKNRFFKQTFSEHDSFVKRLTTGIIPIVITPIFLFYLNNKQAEFTENALSWMRCQKWRFSFLRHFDPTSWTTTLLSQVVPIEATAFWRKIFTR